MNYYCNVRQQICTQNLNEMNILCAQKKYFISTSEKMGAKTKVLYIFFLFSAVSPVSHLQFSVSRNKLKWESWDLPFELLKSFIVAEDVVNN